MRVKTSKKQNINYYMIGSIDDESYLIFSKWLEDVDIDNKYSQLTIELCSTGGEDHASFAFYNKIKSLKVRTVLICNGAIYSAAVLFLASVDVRQAFKSCMFMIHDSIHDLENATSSYIQVMRLYAEKSESMFYTLLQESTNGKSTYQFLRALSKETHYFDSVEALRMGLIDEIIETDNKGRGSLNE